MTRIAALVHMLAFLLGWQLTETSLAAQKQPARWKVMTLKLGPRETKDFQVLRLWNSAAADTKWPQITLLRVPLAVYKQLKKNPKAFIDGNQIFDAPVHISDRCELQEPAEKQDSDKTVWLVTLDHRASVVGCTALLEHEEP